MERDRARCKDGNGEERSGQGHAFQVGEKERKRERERDLERGYREADRRIEKREEKEKERERKERTEN